MGACEHQAPGRAWNGSPGKMTYEVFVAPSEALRIVFMGTPHFAATILEGLGTWQGGELVAVYTRPDKPSGRGHRLTPPPVKIVAEHLGLPVMQPTRLADTDSQQTLRSFRPDVLVVAAYGMILPQAVLDIPRLLPVNVHASLLPLYRGAAPIQRAVIDGRTVTGISIMRMLAGLDTGPVLAQKALGIGYNETAGELHDQLALLGRDVLCETLDGIRAGTVGLEGISQDEARATYARKLEKQDGLINWAQPAAVVHAHIRGVSPWPGAQAQCTSSGREALHLLLGPGKAGAALPAGTAPGTVGFPGPDGLPVACADAWYFVNSIQVRGKKHMDAQSFYNGYLHGKGGAQGWHMAPAGNAAP